MSASTEPEPESQTTSPGPMDADKLKIYLEGALLAAGQPLTLAQLNALFEEDEQPGHGLIREALAALDAELEGRAVELIEVAGGYRLQVRQKLMPVLSRLWAEKPPRYSRALLETLAIIAYRQPITRGEIEQIRGVSLSANILKTLQDRDWIKVVGHRDIPGKPELLGTARPFLDYFGLKGLDDLPTLAEIQDIDTMEPELALVDPDRPAPQDQHEQETNQQPQPDEQDRSEESEPDTDDGRSSEQSTEQSSDQTVEEPDYQPEADADGSGSERSKASAPEEADDGDADDRAAGDEVPEVPEDPRPSDRNDDEDDKREANAEPEVVEPDSEQPEHDGETRHDDRRNRN